MNFALVIVSAIVALVSCESNTTVTIEVTFDIEVKNYNGNGDDISGQVVVGLFGKHVPVASLNFQQLCEGYKRPKVSGGEKRKETKLGYRNTYCHRVVKDMLIQCGDVFNTDGQGSTSIYGEYFNDENFDISYSSGGMVGMANKGKDTNGSQFFITFGSARFFHTRHVAFGKVVKGYQFLAAINKMGHELKTVKPKRPVKITDCSAKDVKSYELSEKDMKTNDLEGFTEI